MPEPIKLEIKDLEGGGARVWWVKTNTQKRAEILGWEDAVFVGIKIVWPQGINTNRHEGYGSLTQSFRVNWVEGMGKAVILPGVPVLDLTACLEVSRAGLSKLALDRRAYTNRRVIKPLTATAGDRVFHVRTGPARKLVEISAALDLRLVESTTMPPMLFAFRPASDSRQLKAVIALREVEE